MYDYDNYLLNLTNNKYYEECVPHPDRSGEPINCIECDNEECEYYEEYHHIFESASQAEMDESLLWGL